MSTGESETENQTGELRKNAVEKVEQNRTDGCPAEKLIMGYGSKCKQVPDKLAQYDTFYCKFIIFTCKSEQVLFDMKK